MATAPTQSDLQRIYQQELGREWNPATDSYWLTSGDTLDSALSNIRTIAASQPKQANPLLPSASQAANPINVTASPAPASIAAAAQPTAQPSAEANPLIPQTYAAYHPALTERARQIGSQIAAGGVPSQELAQQYRLALDDLTYGTNPTGVTPGFGEAITAIYQNALGRMPDQEGLDYWGQQFSSGGQTLQQIDENVRRIATSQGRDSLYASAPLYAGNEWTPAALAGSGMMRQGLAYLQGGGTFDPNAPIAADNVMRTVDDWVGYNATLGTPNQQPVNNQSFIDNANQIYSSIAPGVRPPATAAPKPTQPPSQRPPNPLIGNNNPPPGPLPSSAPTAPLTTRPPTRYASEYPYESPIARQMAAANDQRATPMTQPVGFASDNPLLNRFGTARLGEYTGARETLGNVPGPFRPTVNPLPGIVGAAPGASGSSGSSGSSGLPGGASSALLAAAPALAGMAVPAALDLISKIPGGGAVADKIAGVLGANELAGGNLTFGELLKHPSLGTVVGSALAGLPDILSGDYAQGIGAGLGSYIGATAGTAVGAGIGGIAGNFIIPGLGGLVGAFIGRKAGGLFGPGASVGPNGGQSMEIDRATGRLVPGLSGQDNSGQAQEGFANKFMQGVADVVNEANSKAGGKYAPNYSPNLPLAVEVIGGKINVVDHEGNKQTFAGNDVENAFKYAVGVATAYPGLRMPG